MNNLKIPSQKRLQLILVAAFVAIGVYFLAFSQAATGTATITLSPASGSYLNGTDFTLGIFENSGTVPVAGVDVFLNYDAAKLDFVSVNTTGGVFTDCPSNATSPNPTGGGGTVKISCIKFGTTFTGNQKVGNVTFRPKVGTGTTAVSLASTSAIYDESVSNVWNGVTTGGTYTLTTPDTTGPVVTWNTPTAGQVLGGTNQVSVNVTDDRGTVSAVSLKIGTAPALLPMSKSGNTYTYSWNTGSVGDGPYTLTIVATDPAGNAATGTTTRNVQVLNSKPNLVVSSLQINPASPKVGETVTLTAVVTNNGTAATTAGVSVATGFTVGSTQLTPHTTTASIGINGTVTATATWTATAGPQAIVATADKNNTISNEVSESDNTRTLNVTVYKQADANNDTVIDTKDAVILSLNWGKNSGMTFLTGDFNADGVIDTKDAVILSLNWGK